MRVLPLVLLILLAPLPAAAQATLRAAGPPVALSSPEAGPFLHPRWSPTGAQLAFSGPGYAGLWVVDRDGTGLRQVTDEASAGFGFSWSPDGSALLARVARQEDVRRFHAVKVFEPATGAERALTDYRPSMSSLPEWTPGVPRVVLPGRDGVELLDAGLSPTARKAGTAERFLVLAEGRPTVVNAEEQTARPFAFFEDEKLLNLTPSPDGRRVAFEVLGGNLFVADLGGGAPVDLGRGHRPQWSPDGRWVVFMQTEDDGSRYLSSDLLAARPDGSAVVRLTDTPGRLEMNPSWSPDGRLIAYDDLRDGVVYLLPVAE